MTKPSTRGTGNISWIAVQAGVWVGTRDGEFAGMIEAHWGHGFVATTNLAKRLGEFATLDEAKASFAAEPTSIETALAAG